MIVVFNVSKVDEELLIRVVRGGPVEKNYVEGYFIY